MARSFPGFLALTATVVLGGCIAPHMPGLIGAARDGRVDDVRSFLRGGADPNERAGVNNWTPLMHAVHKNQLQSAITLMEGGADINATTSDGTTALIMAAGYGQTDIVRALLAHGADPRLRRSNGSTALDFAVTGVTDIDEFTLGHCQTATVQALLTAAPDLKLSNDRFVRVMKSSGCEEMRKLLH